MSNLLVSSLGLLGIVVLVLTIAHFVKQENIQRQEALAAAERARLEAERARLEAEAQAERARQEAEVERLRAAQLAAAAQTRREVEQEADAARFWGNVGGIATSILLGFLGGEGGE